MNMQTINFRTGILFLMLVAIICPAIAQEVPVYAEVLVDERKLHIHSPSEATYSLRRRVKILSAKGAGYGQLKVSYDDEFFKLKDASFTVFDEQGKEIKKIKKKDMSDVSLGSGSITNSRAKYTEYKAHSYPYIVEYAYEEAYKGLMFLPAWFPQSGENLSLQNARLEVICEIPNLRYKLIGDAPKPEVSSDGNSSRYIWKLTDLEAWEREPYSPAYSYPGVLLAASHFTMDKYAGDATSWKSLGEFVYKLNEGRDQLPPELAAKVHELTDQLETSEEKIAALYQYMQENTRYVSIQLGIGGWQTFPADYVYEHGFGDCKALSNYMQSMLKEVGITSYSTLINNNGSDRDIHYNFPSSQFNHAILCVPEGEDTTWLECTSSTMPPGYLGFKNDNRHVLLLTPDGGKLVKTPTKAPEHNQQNRVATVSIDAEGNASIKARLKSTGYQYDRPRAVHTSLSPRDQEKWLKRRIATKNIELKGYSFAEGEGPAYQLDYEIVSKKFATLSGPRIFLPLNKLERMDAVPPKMEQRSQNIRLTYPYLDTDTLTYEVPQNLAVEAMPKMPVEIKSEFGHYKANVEVQADGKIVFTRYLRMEKVLLPPEAYDDFRAFYQQVAKADKVQMVLVDKS